MKVLHKCTAWKSTQVFPEFQALTQEKSVYIANDFHCSWRGFVHQLDAWCDQAHQKCKALEKQSCVCFFVSKGPATTTVCLSWNVIFSIKKAIVYIKTQCPGLSSPWPSLHPHVPNQYHYAAAVLKSAEW